MRYARMRDGSIIERRARNYALPNPEDIVRESDDLESLFDGILFKDTCANRIHIVDINAAWDMLGAALFKDTVRGYVETEGGLRYAARLSPSGEGWELL